MGCAVAVCACAVAKIIGPCAGPDLYCTAHAHFMLVRRHHMGAQKRDLLVKGVVLGLVEGAGDEDGHHQSVDGNDTGHDDGDDGLHDQLGPHHRHCRNTRSRLGRAVGSSKG